MKEAKHHVGRHELSELSTLAEKLRVQGEKDPHYALFVGAGASITSGIDSGDQLVNRWRKMVWRGLHGLHDQELNDVQDKQFKAWLECTDDEDTKTKTASAEEDPAEKTAKRAQNAAKKEDPAEDPAEKTAKRAQNAAKNSFNGWRKIVEEQHGRHSSEYSLLFTHFHKSKSDRQQFIETIIDGKEPGPGYIYLASLVLAGRFRILLTTNFDDLIHDALFRYADFKPLVSSFDSQVANIRLDSPRPKIIKLHGDFLYDNIRNTSRETERLGPNMEEKLRASCRERGLIVIGYAGADSSVMGPIRDLLEQRDSALCFGLHWCLYEANSDSARLEVPEALYRMFRNFPERVHLYATTKGFDHVMEVFNETSKCAPPPLLSKPKEHSLYRRLHSALEKSEQIHHVSQKFNKSLRRFMNAQMVTWSDAERYLEEANFEFQDARSEKVQILREQKEEELKEAMAKSGMLREKLSSVVPEDYNIAIQLADKAYEVAEDPNLKAGTRRRSAGAREEKAEIHWHRGELREARGVAEEAMNNVKSGLEIPNATTQAQSLYYNGLAAFAIYYSAASTTEVQNIDEKWWTLGSKWYKELRQMDVRGDDFRELEHDVPGWIGFFAALKAHVPSTKDAHAGIDQGFGDLSQNGRSWRQVEMMTLGKSSLDDSAVRNSLPRPERRAPSDQPPLAEQPVLHIESITLRNVRAFDDFSLPLAPPTPEAGQWIVLVGENGLGKTTLLRSLVFALVDVTSQPNRLPRSTFETPWRRRGTGEDMPTAVHVIVNGTPYRATLTADPDRASIERLHQDPSFPSSPIFAYGSRRGSALGGAARKVDVEPGAEIPTLFDEGADLIHAETWLLLREGAALKDKENDGPAHRIYQAVIDALLAILPGIDAIEPRGDRVWVRGSRIGEVHLDALSDGYLTTMGWVIDLIARWVKRAERRKESIPPGFTKSMTGLVLVDEIDLYLHPEWQQHVIADVRAIFPRMSFVVTTHNPLTLLGARAEEIWKLERDERGRIVPVQGRELPALMTAAQILRNYFGIQRVFPNPLGDKLQRLAFLSASRLRSATEDAEMHAILAELREAGADPGWVPVERER
jgi:energy-coupling factor transporter ATP-binding protein EcfA2